MALPRWATITVVAATLVRVLIALRVPLDADETYYWSWSLHPAYGYTDHPPLMAWLMIAFSIFGKSALAVRLPFILCEAVAAIGVGKAAIALSGNAKAGGVAALILTFVPGPVWMIGQVRPDAPYVCCWALALWLAARLQERATWRDMALLGLALGGTILSRSFGWALVIGIVLWALTPLRRALWRRGLWLALSIAVVLYLPFLAWNAAHGWENLAYTFATREAQRTTSMVHLTTFLQVRFWASAIAFVGVTAALWIRWRHDLIIFTALPLVLALLTISFFQNVESVWLRGPFTSLCVELGIAYVQWRAPWRLFWKVVAAGVAGFSTVLVMLLALPESVQAALLRVSHGAAKGTLYTYVHAYRSLAHDVTSLRALHPAAVLTDRYEIAGQLLYFGAANPILIGQTPLVPQWRRWYDPLEIAPPRAILVTFRPLSADVDTERRIRSVYGVVRAGPVLQYVFAGMPAATFYVTFCERPRESKAKNLFDR